MLIQRDERINWHRILLDLVQLGWPLKTIAHQIGIPPSTLGNWWYDGAEPRYEDGRALLKFHAQELEKKRKKDFPRSRQALQSASRVCNSVTKETLMAGKPKSVRSPGTEAPAEPDPQAGESNVDEAIELAHAGQARRIAKPRAEVAPSPTKGDPQRPKDMPVNAKRQMRYADAMAALEAGELTRSVLTEQGWVCAPLPKPAEPGRM